GSGDIFESREFIKEIMQIIPAEQYLYAHGKNPKILRDISNLSFTLYIDEFDIRKDIIKLGNNSLAWNTWIGRVPGKYVLPGIGCVVEELYRMHNDMLKSIGYRNLSKPVFDYVPNINYDVYRECANVKYWLKTKVKHRKLHLIDNGNVQSNQAMNFDFDPIIEEVANRCKDDFFIITHDSVIRLPNVWTTDEIICTEDGFDLNEISFLSRFCNTIIGRNSGPHVFSQVKDNWMDGNKSFLSFTYQKTGGYFILNQPVLARKYWSPATTTPQVVENILEVIGEY
ncbi:hypothetical protein LCGC14_1784660, partial [marine sediment metagenome]